MAAREKINPGIDPTQAKRIEKLNKTITNANTFEAVAREWHANKLDTWQARTATNILYRLEKDVFPLIGKQPITDVKAPVMLDVLRRIENVVPRTCSSGKAEINSVPSLRVHSSKLQKAITRRSHQTNYRNSSEPSKRSRAGCMLPPGSYFD
jgi:integrase